MHAIIFHAHQKLDRVARRHLRELAPHSFFPGIRQVLQFEGRQGPDDAKLKHRHGEQPWHFINPHDVNDTQLYHQVQHHYDELVMALRAQDDVRAAWQAAWLAHALVDGLTPAHHYPYEAELSELRGGEERHSRKGLIGRAYVKGDTLWQSAGKSAKLVGPRGLLTTHAMFEGGAFTIIAPLKLDRGKPTPTDLERLQQDGVVGTFQRLVQEVAGFYIYERFIARGWTQAIIRDVRRQLAPRMAKMIILAWYAAIQEAEKPATKRKQAKS